MLLLKILSSFCSLQFIAAGGVICDQQYSMFRTRYFKFLEKGGDVFMGVSYSSVRDEHLTQKSNILKKIESESSNIGMPIAFATKGKLAYINIVSIGGDHLHQSGFDSIQENLSRKLSFLGQGKVYIYSALLPKMSQTEIVLFHACHIFNYANHEVEVEKSVLMIISGQVLNEIVGRIKAKPLNVTTFKFPEFEDQDYDICEHLNFYLNECVERNSKIWIVCVELVICSVIGLVAVKYFVMHFHKISDQTKTICSKLKFKRNQVAPTITIATLAQIDLDSN
jgi:hypothetical protein